MLARTCKNQLLNFCDMWSDSNNIQFLTRYMIKNFKKKIVNVLDDEDELLINAFELCAHFHGSLADSNIYGGFDDIMLPIDHYRFAGKVFEMLALRFMTRDEINNLVALNDPSIWHPHYDVKIFMVLFPIIEKKFHEIIQQRKDAEKARQDTYLVCFSMLQGTRQPESTVYNVPVDLMEQHIFPQICPDQSRSIVRFFNNHLSHTEDSKQENSWGLLNTIKRYFW